MRLALTVEYDGTNYHGFQYQVNAASIQEELEKSIARVTGERVRVRAAGRTDAGVHAKGQVVAFDTAADHSADTFVRALNYYLPADIAVRRAWPVPDAFDPRRHALSRAYKYTVLNSATRSPLLRRRALQVEAPLDVDAMRRAAQLFVGRHDFARFGAARGARGGSTVREIYRACACAEAEVIALDFEGSAFLAHQVRRMAGSLVDVGLGALAPGDIEALLSGEICDAVARALPPHGLCLLRVTYADQPRIDGE